VTIALIDSRDTATSTCSCCSDCTLATIHIHWDRTQRWPWVGSRVHKGWIGLHWVDHGKSTVILTKINKIVKLQFSCLLSKKTIRVSQFCNWLCENEVPWCYVKRLIIKPYALLLLIIGWVGLAHRKWTHDARDDDKLHCNSQSAQMLRISESLQLLLRASQRQFTVQQLTVDSPTQWNVQH